MCKKLIAILTTLPKMWTLRKVSGFRIARLVVSSFLSPAVRCAGTGKLSCFELFTSQMSSSVRDVVPDAQARAMQTASYVVDGFVWRSASNPFRSERDTLVLVVPWNQVSCSRRRSSRGESGVAEATHLELLFVDSLEVGSCEPALSPVLGAVPELVRLRHLLWGLAFLRLYLFFISCRPGRGCGRRRAWRSPPSLSRSAL